MARILIVDDDKQIRSMLRQALERDNHEVMENSSGDGVSELYGEWRADLVITDIIMPGKEGLETIIELKGDYPDSKIIAISGGGSHVKSKNCLEAAQRMGAQQVFSKPVKLDILLKSVRELLATD